MTFEEALILFDDLERMFMNTNPLLQMFMGGGGPSPMGLAGFPMVPFFMNALGGDPNVAIQPLYNAQTDSMTTENEQEMQGQVHVIKVCFFSFFALYIFNFYVYMQRCMNGVCQMKVFQVIPDMHKKPGIDGEGIELE